MNLRTVDPRIKLLMLAVLSSAAVFSHSLFVLAALLVLNTVLLLTGGVPAGRILALTKNYLRIILALFVIQCLFNRSGEPLVSIRGFALITGTSLRTAFMVSLRLLIIVTSALIVLTGDARDYLLALMQLRLPYELAFMVVVALRFIPMLREEARDVLAAVQMRGFNIKKAPLQKKLSAYASVLVPIVAGALHRSEQTSISMEARAFRAFPRRTTMRRLSLKASDWLFFGVFAAIILLIFVIRGTVPCMSF